MPIDYSEYDQWTVKSTKEGNKDHKITYVDEEDKYICSCPANIYHKKTCRHILQVVDFQNHGRPSLSGPLPVEKEADSEVVSAQFTKENFLEELNKIL